MSRVVDEQFTGAWPQPRQEHWVAQKQPCFADWSRLGEWAGHHGQRRVGRAKEKPAVAGWPVIKRDTARWRSRSMTRAARGLMLMRMDTPFSDGRKRMPCS